ncbi:MAG: membrane protein insertase YidC [Alphaproteobacteria bacterium]|nr:membrane protein insertase YidC [Alphaproteobacteria bacterium]
MDQKRLFLAIALSITILLGFQFLLPPPKPPVVPTAATAPITAPVAGTATPAAPATGIPGNAAAIAAAAAPREVPRVKFTAPRVQGSVSLLGARLDDLVLRDYRETIEPGAKQVRLLEPRGGVEPTFVQFGWTAAEGSGVAVPDEDTLWAPSGELAPGQKLTLSWDNKAGVTYELIFSVDANYLFAVEQRVRNASAKPVALYPWSRVRRDYTPVTAGYYVLHEGMLGVLDGKLHDDDLTYAKVKEKGEKTAGLAFALKGVSGWAGITDKYWLTALVPDKAAKQDLAFRYVAGGTGGYQVDFLAVDATAIAAGATASSTARLFAGAKEVHLLDTYEKVEGIINFDKAVDFGWFYFLTKPFFYAIDWLNGVIGNFGVAILVFTSVIKGLFFPLANKSYRSMAKMKELAPKMTILREQHKDNQQELQKKMMELYRAEKVNPASGCLPIIIQIPVFFSLYKVIFVTIEMRHAPFFGWIRDLSAVDPTNIFNLFGLIPFDPTTLPMFGSMLHLGVWPVLMGITMYFQQMLNPPPPDPVQAKLFQYMPILFTFMMGSFPAGLVIYWSWNNLLTIAQQSFIMRQAKRAKPARA